MFGNVFKGGRARVYLDHAAATPLDGDVRKAMEEYQREHFGNPGSAHKEGVYAKEKVDTARKQVADFFRAHEDEIVFTSSGTEANNLAIRGVLRAHDAPLSELHAVTTAIEHPSVLDVFKQLEKEGLSVAYIPVDESGHVNPKDIGAALRENTALVSVIHASNEIGTLQPVREIAKEMRRFKKRMLNVGRGMPEHAKVASPLLHIDACQTASYVECVAQTLGVDLLSASSSKVYGPKGAGVLYVRRGVYIAPILWGGGQELGRRAGTEDVVGIIGCGVALEKTEQLRERESARLATLREYFERELLARFPKATLNGAGERVPNIVNVSFLGFDNEELVLRLDAKGVACATRSACQTRDEGLSYVVEALGEGHDASSAIRFSMGRGTSTADINHTLDALREIFDTMNKTLSG